MNSAPEKLTLPLLQSKMKCDPEGYECELVLLYNQFKSSMELFKQQASIHFTSVGGIGSNPSVAKDLSDRAMFLAHVTHLYPKHLIEFPKQLVDLLNSSSKSLPSGLCCHIAQALILLINRKMVDIQENLALFVELQTLAKVYFSFFGYKNIWQDLDAWCGLMKDQQMLSVLLAFIHHQGAGLY
ncbi:protein SDA1-like protein isoform X1 [Cucumis melo var. makuwa]|uniref:Protein SDA1 n=1 Tax=Cucumis melo var. makuwa TaxID=1194695 RepID=A0A5A7T0H3_CUCMM|nr:protein SDA1-like protein isoform X1 [Cucumis melo var. makuwa]TYK21211.1 protein SDA1-like protein isoform X1 [Cucumis melo var. makuwa]